MQMEKIPKIDLAELKKEMKINRQQRLEFVRQYTEWLKKTPNKVWSRQHAEFLGK